MKTTIELPDQLLRTVKVAAAREGRSMKDLFTELVRRGLAERDRDRAADAARVQLPLVIGEHPAPEGEEMTPERIAQILAAEEAEAVSR